LSVSPIGRYGGYVEIPHWVYLTPSNPKTKLTLRQSRDYYTNPKPKKTQYGISTHRGVAFILATVRSSIMKVNMLLAVKPVC